MSNARYIPESGISQFPNGCRVLVFPDNLVGTVLGFKDSEYLVRFMNVRNVLEIKSFKESSLIEQYSLPFEENPF